ncbi:hypothetical protein ECTW09195_4971, partial [Escherichia coli TW09195]
MGDFTYPIWVTQ